MSVQAPPSPFEIVRAVETLKSAGFIFSPPEDVALRIKLFTLTEASELTGLDLTWLQRHLDEFPSRLKPPGSPIRITLADIEAAYERWRTGTRIDVSTSVRSRRSGANSVEVAVDSPSGSSTS